MAYTGNTRRTQAVSLTGIQLPWWVVASTGVVWLVFAMVVLQFDLTAATSIALAVGLLLIVAAFSQLVTASAARQWRWVHALLAAIFFVGGLIALVWPDPTVLALARLLAWFLLFKGCADLVLGLAVRSEAAEKAAKKADGETWETLWWVFLVVAAAEFGVAFWAAVGLFQEAGLLMLWTGLLALFTGVTDVALAFALRTGEKPGPSPEGAPAETSPLSGGADER